MKFFILSFPDCFNFSPDSNRSVLYYIFHGQFVTIGSTCAQRIVASIICKSLRFEPSIERDLQVSNFTGRPRVFQGASKNNDPRTGFTARTVGRYKFPAEVMRVEEV